MRRGACGLVALVFSLAWCPAARAQSIQTIVSSGPTSKRINITFFSEGYTEAQFPQFIADVQSVLVPFFLTPPYNVYSNCFNIHAVSVASAQSGSDHYTPTTQLVDTYFNSSFDNYGADRALTIPPNSHTNVYALGQGKVDALVASLIPESDMEIVLVNDPQYGGTGGARIVMSVDPSAPEIALHEMGHTLAQLGDEYEDFFPYGDQEEPNTTRQTERSFIKWNSWILPNTPVPTPDVSSNYSAVGLFEGAHYHTIGWFRPQHICKMRALNASYCAVCREAVVLSIYRLVRPIDAFTPFANVVTLTNSQAFRVIPLKAGFTYQWFTNNVAVSGATQSNLLLNPQLLGPGTHSVRVEVHDPTAFVRSDPERLLFDTNTWLVNVTSVLAITSQPQNQDVTIGSPASLSVSVSGAPPITYQWRFGGDVLDGQTTSTLTITNVAPEDAGTYDVIVANDSASLTSAVATLTVHAPIAPSILISPVDRTVHVGQTTTFQILAHGSAPLTFFWQRDSTVVATNASPTLTITNAQFTDAGNYFTVVSNVAGIATSSSAVLTILPAEPLPAGVYSGLFFTSNDVRQSSSGSFTATVHDAGDFLARVQIGTSKQNFRGQFGVDGRATNVVTLQAVPLLVMLSIDARSAETIVGEVAGQDWASPLLAHRMNPDAKFAGRYTLLLGGSNDPSMTPPGNGFASLRVNKGIATISGWLADGTRLSGHSPIVGDGQLPFYAPLYAGKGAMFGWLRLKPETFIDLDGAAHWIRPPMTSAKFYPAGFTIPTPILGSTFTPSSGTVFDIVLGRVLLSGGNLESPRTNYVTLGIGGRITAAGPDTLRLKMTAGTGLFNGTVTPSGEKPIRIRGAVLQRQRFGGGFFLGTNEAGAVYFGP